MRASTPAAAFKGTVQVYTGNGKGKTTAALGLALRAAGHGYRTYIGQFMKGQHYGELVSLKRLSSWIQLEQFGRKSFLHVTKDPKPGDIRRARRGLQRCLKAMRSGRYRIIVLDEVNVALYFNLLDEKDVLSFLDRRPADVEVVLTGRYAPPAILRRADLVTEMKEKKHYYRKGLAARDGIEK